MSGIITAVVLFTWWAFALADGNLDAYHFDRVERKNGKPHRNIHPVLWFRRLFAFGGQLAVCYFLGWWWMLAGLVLVFSFLHDGAYYSRRHRLNERIYARGWWSGEDDTDRRSPYLWRLWEPRPRAIMALIGLGLIVVHFVWG